MEKQKLTRDQVIQIIENLDWDENADLMNKDLTGIDLQNIDFGGVLLNGTNISKADCRGSTFEDASLIIVNATSANMSGVDLSGADLYNAKFVNANLQEARCNSARHFVFSVDLEHAKLQKSDFAEIQKQNRQMGFGHFMVEALEREKMGLWIDRMTEKMLVEIISSANEGVSVRRIAQDLGTRQLDIKHILKKYQSLEDYRDLFGRAIGNILGED